MGDLQHFEWGTIEWIYMPGNNPYTVMHIGTITVKPGCRQNKHVHYSDEQLLYVLSGEGRQIINENTTALQPGMIFHMEPGDMHETINTGEEDLVELLISIPVDLDDDVLMQRLYTPEAPESDAPIALKDYAEAILAFHDNLLRPLNVPISVFDIHGAMILRGDNFPPFCQSVCDIGQDLMNCELYRIRDEYKPPYYFEHTSYVCRYGITMIFLPIIYRQEVVGFIRGGHVREAERIIEVATGHELPYERSRSSMNSLIRLLIRFQKSIQNHLELAQTSQKMLESESRIQTERQQKQMLEQSLRQTRSRMLNIQINNHFLFNTLSAIANLALDDGSLKTYDAIIHLSKMFRYSMKSQSKGSRLQEEIAYLEDYLKLQQIRFGERLRYTIDIEPGAMEIEVPFNFLQPLVENAFKHGVDENHRDLDLRIGCDCGGDWLELTVSDNGKGMSTERKEQMEQRLYSRQGRLSGMMMVLIKLERLYGPSVTLTIDSEPDQGTTLTVRIPKAQVNV